MNEYVRLGAGDPAPWFRQRTSANPQYAFDTAAGRYLVLCFFATAADPVSRAAINAAFARKDIFNDEKASFFGVSLDPNDEKEKRVENSYPGYRFFWDFDARVSSLYGATPIAAADIVGSVVANRRWVILDPTLRIIDVIDFEPNGDEIAKVFDFLDKLPPPSAFPGFEISAPIIILPNVFERNLCAELISLYEKFGGVESGFMREIDGKTVGLTDHAHKRRRDYLITDENMRALTRKFVERRVIPEIRKVHQFRVTRMERYIISCYDAADHAHFRAHRDNTTSGTAHRRFAVSINLNEDYDGGEIYFPEYGTRTYKPPVGGAAIFSCSLLHAVTRMTRGRRFAFLPFLYDEDAAKLREQNNSRLSESVGKYQMTERGES